MKDKLKTMLMFYAITLATVATTAGIAYLNGTLPKNGFVTALQWLNFIFLVLTFVFMEGAMKEKKGKRYAQIHGWSALILTFVFGIGFLVWPPMMYAKLKGIKP